MHKIYIWVLSLTMPRPSIPQHMAFGPVSINNSTLGQRGAATGNYIATGIDNDVYRPKSLAKPPRQIQDKKYQHCIRTLLSRWFHHQASINDFTQIATFLLKRSKSTRPLERQTWKWIKERQCSSKDLNRISLSSQQEGFGWSLTQFLAFFHGRTSLARSRHFCFERSVSMKELR